MAIPDQNVVPLRSRGDYKYEREELARRLAALDRDLKHAKEILQDTCLEFNWIVEHLTKRKDVSRFHKKK